jgi:hypothetical protein
LQKGIIVLFANKLDEVLVGACHNSICCVFSFLARFLFQSSFFSKSRLCTWPFFSHFGTNLDRLAGQPIQIFLRSRFRIQIFYVFPHGVNPVGDNCMMTKASLRRGRQCNGSILGLCCCCHRLVTLLPSSPLVALLLFGVIIVIVAIVTVVAVVAVVAVIAIVAVAIFDPVTIIHATVVVTLAVVAAWFL